MGRAVLREVDLVVGPGEVVAVMGANGTGKSTLIAALGGLLRPVSGTIESTGRPVTALQPGALADRRALANVELALAWWGVPSKDRRIRALTALRDLRADHLADRPVGELSGGERRRIHLARALAVQADLVLLDEPFSGLDTQTRQALVGDLSRLLRQSGRAAVVAVHDRFEAWALADRIVILAEGRVAADAAPRALLSDPPTIEVAQFLGFTGKVTLGDGSLLVTRPAHARLNDAGHYAGTVTARLGVEDGVLLDIELDAGVLQARVEHPGPGIGDRVRVEIAGGVRFKPNSHRCDRP